MPNGDLFPPDDPDSPAPAATSAASAFPDEPPGATAACPAPGGAAPAGGPAWTHADVKSSLDACDNSLNIWSKGKTGNGGTEPVIKEGSSVIGSGASVSGSVVTIDKGRNKCEATQLSVQELSNMSHAPELAKLQGADCTGGTLSRDDFMRGNERLEYDGLKNTLSSFDACKAKWGCAATATSVHDWARGAKDFDDYYNNYLGAGHKNYWGGVWDSRCKAGWDAKHPAPPPPPPAKPPTPPSGAPPAPSSNCFIATAAYGSSLAPEVAFLRSIRDDIIRKTEWGREYFERYWSYYYRFSPAVAEHMGQDADFKSIMRWSIVTPWVQYMKLVVNRPSAPVLDGLDPELRTFLEALFTDMQQWLSEIPLPRTFDGREASEAVDELNIILGYVLREPERGADYLARLGREGALPLRYAPDRYAELRDRLQRGGRSPEQIAIILSGTAAIQPSSADGDDGRHA